MASTVHTCKEVQISLKQFANRQRITLT